MLYVKGTCNVTLYDIESGDARFQSDKVSTGSINTSTNLNEIRAGLGNPIAAMIASDSSVTVDFDIADFSIWLKAAQTGSAITRSAPVMKCVLAEAIGNTLAIDISQGAPVARLGEDDPICYVQETNQPSLVLNDGIAYPIDSDGVISGYSAEEGKVYKVWYYAQHISAQVSEIKAVIDPGVYRFETQIAVFANQTGNRRQGTRVGWLYITIPYLKLNGDAPISGDQTSPDVTKLSGTALAFDPNVVSMSTEDCEASALAYYVYAPDDESSNIIGIAVVGGTLQVDTETYMQIPVRLVAGDGSLVIPTNTQQGFTYESEDITIATVNSSGLVYGEQMGETEIEITYTDSNDQTYECVINVISIWGPTSDKVGYGKVGFMIVGEETETVAG